MNPRANGFSLVELLVVITIICVLFALLMPVIGMMRASAQTLTCSNHLRGMGVGLLTVANNDHGMLPWGLGGPAPGPYSWVSALNNLDEQMPLTCPSAPIKAGTVHYTGNMQVLSSRGFGGWWSKWRQVRDAELRPEVVMLFDGGQYPTTAPGGTYGDARPISMNMGFTFRFLGQTDDSWATAGQLNGQFKVETRHAGWKRANYLFGDGHVQSLTPMSLTNAEFRINAAGRKYF